MRLVRSGSVAAPGCHFQKPAKEFRAQHGKTAPSNSRVRLRHVSSLGMSTKHTKSEKSQKADELEKRQDDRPDENEMKEVEREEPAQADIDSVRH